ncbi:Ycf48-like protein [anaerobic digester metagenome]
MNGLHKMSDGSLLATGSGGFIIRTLNGVVWDTLHIGEMNTTLTDIAFVNDQIGFATGTNGYICKTINGGLNWAPEQINQGIDIGGICISTTDRISAAGSDSSYFVSTDTCQTWTQFNYGFDMGESRGIVRASATQLFAFGSEGMFITNDAGLSWAESGSYSQVYSGFALNSDSAFFGFINAGIKYTYDGGATYTDMITVNPAIQGIYFFNADTGIFVNSWGRLYRTTDRGINWILELNTGISLQDIYFIDDTLGYVMGERGQLYKTTDQGQNWQLIETGTMRTLYKMWFTPDGTGFIVGGDGIVLRKSAVPVFDVDFVVLNDDGDTLTNASMNFNNIDYPAGILSVQGLAADSYEYIFSFPGHRNDTGIVVLTSDTVLTVELKKYHNVTFRLSNVYSDLIGNAGIKFNGDSLITNATGEVVFTDIVKASAMNYEIREIHYLPESGIADIGGDTVFEFTIMADIAAPVPQTVTSVSDHSFTAVWLAGTNAAEYALFVSDDNFVSVLPCYDSVIVTALNYDVNGLTPGLNYYFRLRSVNIYGYSAYSVTGTAATTTGVNDQTVKTVMAYPVPADDFVTVILSGNFSNESILLIDATGRTVLESEAGPECIINLSGLESGVYYIKADNNVCRVIKK